MTTLKLYYNLMSQPSRALYIFLKKAKIPFESKVVNLMNGEQFTKEFEAINPLHKVPVIDHKGFILTESIAILRYICHTYNVADHWYPKDLVKQARVDEYLEWQHTNTRAACALYYLHKVIWPIMHNKPVNKVRIAQLEGKMDVTLDIIENVWLKDKKYLCGNEISISDIICICEIDQTKMTDYDPYMNRPNLSKWKMRLVPQLSPYYEEAIKMFEYSTPNSKLISKI